MTGSKLLIGSALLLVLAMLAGGIYFPQTALMSMADTSTAFMALRIAIAGVLVVLLVTRPPRSYGVRRAVGVLSVALGALSVSLLLQYEVRILDALVFLEVAILLAIEALEVRTIDIKQEHQPPRRIAVRTT